MKMLAIIALLAVYPAGVYVNAGFALANVQRSFPTIAEEKYRADLGFAYGFSLVPIFWAVTPFITGFYEHGWMKPVLHPKGER